VKASSNSFETEQTQVKKRKPWHFFKRGLRAKELTIDTGEPDDVMEVWFSGCHSDIGGGAVVNTVEHSLSNITLRWMVREVVASGCSVIFDTAALSRAQINLDPQPTTSDIEMDSIDALQPLDDELHENVLWWLLEILPFPFCSRDAAGVRHKNYTPNLGRGRQIVDPHPNMHITVKKRIESQLKYTPKAKWISNSEVYVQ